MSDIDELREELEDERKARRSLQVQVDRLEERVDKLSDLLSRHLPAASEGSGIDGP